MNTFESLLVDLAKSELKFILVGGLAVGLCGFTRTTLDVDILIEDSPSNIEKLLARLTNFGEGHASELLIADFTPDDGCIRIVEDFALDIFTRMSGNTYADLLGYSTTYSMSGVEITHLTAEGLILLKKNSVRPKDRIDVDELKRIIEAKKI